MEILNNLGISYKAGYLVQGNQIERCNTSTSLKVSNTELQVRTDGKDSNIENILKNYKGNIVFHLPAVNPDLSNLELVNNIVKNIKADRIKLVTINASNLSLGLFEFSTLEEQKKYFLNIVTAIATLASNKIPVAVENLKHNSSDTMFGSDINQFSDILIYTRKMLVKDFGFSEEDAEKYLGISLNLNNIDLNENINDYINIFYKNIKCIKIDKNIDIKLLFDILRSKEIDVPIFMETTSDLEDIKTEYRTLEKNILEQTKNDVNQTIIKKEKKTKKEKVKTYDNKGFSNIIVYTMIVLTIVIVILMFIVKLK